MVGTPFLLLQTAQGSRESTRGGLQGAEWAHLALSWHCCPGRNKQGSLSVLPVLTKAWKEVFLQEEEGGGKLY